MADFKTPNLCGANPELNNALSKIDDLIGNIDSKISSAASEAAAAIETGLANVKAGLDGLAIDLPEIPDVNFQSELTGLINDIDKTTIQGLATFNSKLAQLELDFGDTLKEKGLTLDSLITDATTKLSSGGNLCELAPNIEIPSGSSGTGITIQEIEERGTGSSVTLTQTPKEILSVTGKTTTQSFFTNIQYKQNGKVIVPSADGTYSDIKVLYTVSLIKEKPVEAKQADTSPDAEEVSIVTTNTSAKDTSFEGLIAKFKKDIETAPSSKDISKDFAGIKSAISFLGSPEGKTKQEKDFATWQTEYKKLKADPLNYKPVVTPNGETVKATIPEDTVTKEIKTDISGATYTETKRVTSSDAGFSSRQRDVFLEICKIDKAKEVFASIDALKFPDAYDFVEDIIENSLEQTSASSIELPNRNPVWSIQYVSIGSNIFYNPKTRVIDPAGVQQYDIKKFDGNEIVQRGADDGDNLFYKLDGQTMTFRDAVGRPVDPFISKYIFAIDIGYRTLDKIDPNYTG